MDRGTKMLWNVLEAIVPVSEWGKFTGAITSVDVTATVSRTRQFCPPSTASPMDLKIAFVFLPVVVFGIIRNNNELYCDFEEQFCAGWRNESAVPNDRRITWRTAKTGVVLDAWHSIPRADQGDRFAFVLGGAGQEPDVAWLVSDTIPCLLVPGILTFSYWKNAFLSGLIPSSVPRLKVLIREPPSALNPKLLFDVGPYNSVGWRNADINVPSVDKPFQLVIQAEVQSAFDLVAIDQIMFRGYIEEKHCLLSETARESLLESGLYERVMESIRSSRPSPSDTIDTQITWPPPQSTDFSFFPNFGSGSGGGGSGSGWEQLTAGVVNQFLPVIDAPVETRSNSDVLLPTPQSTTLATVIERLLGQAAQSPNNRLIQDRMRVNRPITDITDALAAASRSRPLLLPKSSATIDGQQSSSDDSQHDPVSTEATNSQQPKNANVDESTEKKSPTTKDANFNACKAASCDFEESTCGFEGTESDSGAWTVVQGRIGDAMRGISRAAFGRYYVIAYANNKKGNNTQVLRGQPFRTSTKSLLSFWYSKSPSPVVRLLLCDVLLDNCLWERRSPVADRKRRSNWQLGSVVLPAGRHQMMFVVENLSAHEFVAVDEISLRQTRDGPMTHCEMET